MLHEKSHNEGNTDSSEDGNLYDPKYISENMAGLQITAFGFCWGKCYKQDHLSWMKHRWSNDHLRSTDLFRSEIIQNNRSKVVVTNPHPSVLLSVFRSFCLFAFQSFCLHVFLSLYLNVFLSLSSSLFVLGHLSSFKIQILLRSFDMLLKDCAHSLTISITL